MSSKLTLIKHQLYHCCHSHFSHLRPHSFVGHSSIESVHMVTETGPGLRELQGISSVMRGVRPGAW